MEVIAVDQDGHGPAPRSSQAAAAIDDPIYRLEDVIKIYRELDVETVALRGIDLAIERGSFVAIMGRSGSGKSTLLNLMAAADRPSAGKVRLAGRDLAAVDESERARIRGREVGVVFQSQNLLPNLSLEENLRLAVALAGQPDRTASARDGLALVGLADRAGHRPDQLSGGEQQRAALACVLAAGPSVLLGDEVTGELDTASAEAVLDAIRDARAAFGTTVVLVTHDQDVARRAERIVELRDGRIVADRTTS
jgi:ABC-type lipoprotein export system ATPase subunit